MRTSITWIRWFGVLPAAFAAYLLSFALIQIVASLGQRFNYEDDLWYKIIGHIVIPAVAAFSAGNFFIETGYDLSPSHRHYSALVLVIIMAMFSGISVWLLITKEFIWNNLIVLVAQLVGAIVAYIDVLKKVKYETDH